ncbi:hypothetical protein EJP77_01730 [Paenibacillus zeisoli]|uniref:Uncharacterized protein n=1 Tax=Paenibacillus zeisoli TaxID=2496267 RepID=A0A433XNU8_9BACL|nr:hypothetical protein [Paenibacillus zeisoli]RUT35763.1 hypothetical protein EJP77_01730 [Paenibacillus zeisoli]
MNARTLSERLEKGFLMMLIQDGIILRQTKMEDINDYIEWYTTKTEWMNWDAPWEQNNQNDLNNLVEHLKHQVSLNTSVVPKRLEICLGSGTHIGWVNSYFIESDETKLAIGINLPGKKIVVLD